MVFKLVIKDVKCIPISNGSSKTTIQTIAKELDEGNMVVFSQEGCNYKKWSFRRV